MTGARPDDQTSIHTRRAVHGDPGSVAWLVEHFGPALHVQARYRLRGPLAEWYAPDDLVQDVWTIALPRLRDLVARDGRMTPVLVRFLSATLLNRVNQLLRDYLRDDRPRSPDSLAAGVAEPPPAPLARSQDGVSQGVERIELQRAVRDALDRLEGRDREVVVLRGIEQLSNNKVAEVLGVQPSAVSMRYHSALEKLRRLLPGSVFDELAGG